MRLIDADELLKESERDKDFRLVIPECTVKKAPTIDPESLRPHGQWLGKIVLVNGIMSQECSHCHRIRSIDDFCAACGAKMDEEA